MILILQNVDNEGPGTLGEFLVNRQWDTKTIELYDQSSSFSPLLEWKEAADMVSGIDAIVIMGGPMNVYEEHKHPFLVQEQMFLKKAVQNHIPILGICLGAQLLAKILGGRIAKSPAREIGWYTVQLTDSGINDPLFAGLCPELDVFQWHEDMFYVPMYGTLLAASEQCPFQAFRYNNNVYGLQFHIEVTEKEIYDWTDAGSRRDRMLSDYGEVKEKFNAAAQQIYKNFENIIKINRNNVKNICK